MDTVCKLPVHRLRRARVTSTRTHTLTHSRAPRVRHPPDHKHKYLSINGTRCAARTWRKHITTFGACHKALISLVRRVCVCLCVCFGSLVLSRIMRFRMKATSSAQAGHTMGFTLACRVNISAALLSAIRTREHVRPCLSPPGSICVRECVWLVCV